MAIQRTNRMSAGLKQMMIAMHRISESGDRDELSLTRGLPNHRLSTLMVSAMPSNKFQAKLPYYTVKTSNIDIVGHCNICRAQYSPKPIHQLLCVSYSHVHLTMSVYIKQ